MVWRDGGYGQDGGDDRGGVLKVVEEINVMQGREGIGEEAEEERKEKEEETPSRICQPALIFRMLEAKSEEPTCTSCMCLTLLPDH